MEPAAALHLVYTSAKLGVGVFFAEIVSSNLPDGPVVDPRAQAALILLSHDLPTEFSMEAQMLGRWAIDTAYVFARMESSDDGHEILPGDGHVTARWRP